MIQDPFGLFPTSNQQRAGKPDRRSREERDRDERVALGKRAVATIGFMAIAATVLWLLTMLQAAGR